MKYQKNVYRSLVLITQFGINMIVPIFLCSFLGVFLDKKFGTNFCVIILFFVGAIAGYRNVYKMAGTINKKKSEKDRYDNKHK